MRRWVRFLRRIEGKVFQRAAVWCEAVRLLVCDPPGAGALNGIYSIKSPRSLTVSGGCIDGCTQRSYFKSFSPIRLKYYGWGFFMPIPKIRRLSNANSRQNLQSVPRP